MHSKCINSTSVCKSFTGNGFSNVDFLYDILAGRHCFLANYADFSQCMHSFDHRPTTTFGLKSDVIVELSFYHTSSCASAVLGVVILSVRLSVHLSVCYTRGLWDALRIF